MKTKTPKCPICKKPMKVIYTKCSYVSISDNKRKYFWSKEGYLCNDFFEPVVKITSYKEVSKGKAKENYLVGVYNISITELLEILPIIVAPLTREYYRRFRVKINHYKRTKIN